MTYLQFHAIWILPALAVLFFLSRRKLTRAHGLCIAGVCAVAVAFTLPWDHAAVVRRIWEFDDSKVLFRFWKLPIEEIAFFVLESTGVCLLTLLFLPQRRSA